MIRTVRIRALCFGLFGSACLAAAADLLPPSTRVDKADAWSALFSRAEGWTGADGIFSIPLSGYEG